MLLKLSSPKSSHLKGSDERLMREYQTPKPISVRVGYEWQKKAGDKARDKKAPQKDDVWPFLRDQIDRVLKSVQKTTLKKSIAPWPFSYRLGRMRARQGASLLPRFIELCETSDIVVFDISKYNPNVMFELGLAVAIKGVASGRVFVLMEAPSCDEIQQGLQKVPGDLAGYFITFYTRKKNGFEICDKQGFNAALKAIVLDDARSRGMIVAKGPDAE